MIDKIRSKKYEIKDVRDFKVGGLYLQHCQQYEDIDSPEDILRIFNIGAENIVYGIGKERDNVTLRNQPVYTTNLDPHKFDKGKVNLLKSFRINLKETYMGHFFHITHGSKDISDLFNIDLSGHTNGEHAIIEEPSIEDIEARWDNQYAGILIG